MNINTNMKTISMNLQNPLQIVPSQAQPFYNNIMEDKFMRNHSMLAHQSNAVVANLHAMNYNQINEIYGIEISPDGTVTDSVYGMKFSNLSEWADWCIENDEYEETEIIRHKNYDALT